MNGACANVSPPLHAMHICGDDTIVCYSLLNLIGIESCVKTGFILGGNMPVYEQLNGAKHGGKVEHNGIRDRDLCIP